MDKTAYLAKEKSQCVVLENTTGKALDRYDFIKEIRQYRTKCFQCKTLVSKIQNLLDNVNTIKQKEIVGVCQYCRKYNERGNCKRCEAVVGKFLENRLTIERSQLECMEEITNNLLGFLKSIFDHGKICNHVRDKCILKSNELQEYLEYLMHFKEQSREIEITEFPDAYSELESGSFIREKMIESIKDELDMMQNKMNVLKKRLNSGDHTTGHVKDTNDNSGKDELDMMQKKMNVLKKRLNLGDHTTGHVKDTDDNSGKDELDMIQNTMNVQKKRFNVGDHTTGHVKCTDDNSGKDELDMMQNKMNVLKKIFKLGDHTTGHVKGTDDNSRSPDYMVKKTLNAISTSMKRVSLSQNKNEKGQVISKLSQQKMYTQKEKNDSHYQNKNEKGQVKSKLSQQKMSTQKEKNYSHITQSKEFMKSKELKSKLTNEKLDKEKYNSSLPNQTKERIEQKAKMRNVNKNITAGFGRKPLGEKVTITLKNIKDTFTIDKGLIDLNVHIKNETPHIKKTEQMLETRKVEHIQELDHVSIATVDFNDIARCIENNSQRTSKIIVGNEIVPLDQEDLNVTRTISDKQLSLMELVEKSAEESSQHMTHTSSKTSNKTQSIKWAFEYKLSDPYFIANGWTQLPKESIIKEVLIFKMIPTDCERNWFTMNHTRKLIPYDNGTIFAKFETNGNCKIFYKNGNLALEYYNSRDNNDGCRFKVFSSGEVTKTKQVVLAVFDYDGNGIVYDDKGIMRLKYNQRHGVILDKNIGVPRRWKWLWCGILAMKPKFKKVYEEIHDDTGDQLPKIISKTKDKPLAQVEISNTLRDMKQNKHVKSNLPWSQYDLKVGPFQINNKFKLNIVNQNRIILSFIEDKMRFKINVGLKLLCDEVIERFFVDINDYYTPFEKEYNQVNDTHQP